MFSDTESLFHPKLYLHLNQANARDFCLQGNTKKEQGKIRL